MKRRSGRPPAAGVFAAGEGLRLQAAGPVKPMIRVAGRPLCEWVVGGLRAAGAGEVLVLVNSRGSQVPEALRRAFPGLKLDFLVRDTATSWESFRLVSRALAARAESFVLSTVDALIPPEEAARFMDEARGSTLPALALTSPQPDDKPLWAELGPDGLIGALGAECRRREHVTAGLYGLSAAEALRLPAADAFATLRAFWTERARRGGVRGIPIGPTRDVDRPEDIPRAEAFLKEATAWLS